MTREKKRIENEIDDCQQKLNALFDLLNIEEFHINIGVLIKDGEWTR
jgi:hypothetical protein